MSALPPCHTEAQLAHCDTLPDADLLNPSPAGCRMMVESTMFDEEKSGCTIEVFAAERREKRKVCRATEIVDHNEKKLSLLTVFFREK